jgi:hypothetical protein
MTITINYGVKIVKILEYWNTGILEYWNDEKMTKIINKLKFEINFSHSKF